MPIYEYECRTNGHRFEVKQSFSDDALTTCQVCDEPVRKIFSAAGIVFKGSGYYVTDTRGTSGRSGDAKGSSTSKGSSDAKASSGSTGSGDSGSGGSSSTTSASSTSSSGSAGSSD